MRFALLGHPVAHSLSPAIHRTAYKELAVSAEYGLLDAPTEADAERVIESVRTGELAGINITIPWKRKAYAAATRRTALAERLQVANVLAMKDGELWAHNTDALALELEFRRLASTQRALVIGSGGATPAVVAACRATGIDDVRVTARRFTAATPEHAWPGAAGLTALGARVMAWPESSEAARLELERACDAAGLVVQCTSAGMHGADSGEPLAALVPWSRLPKTALAYDLIYNPLETPFLRVAREHGLRTSHGLNMLVEQAALAIEIWLGKKPTREPLAEAALAALAKRSAS